MERSDRKIVSLFSVQQKREDMPAESSLHWKKKMTIPCRFDLTELKIQQHWLLSQNYRKLSLQSLSFACSNFSTSPIKKKEKEGTGHRSNRSGWWDFNCRVIFCRMHLSYIASILFTHVKITRQWNWVYRYIYLSRKVNWYSRTSTSKQRIGFR